MSSKYTDAEKIAYYKAKAARPRATKRVKARVVPRTARASHARRNVRVAASRQTTAPARLGQSPGDVGIHLSPATESYMHSVLNPADAPAAGMPVGGIPSEKNKCWTRGKMNTGTTGFGFIMVSPGLGMANDSVSIYNSIGTYAGSTLTTAATGVVSANSNSPYASSAFSASGLKGRLVACEVRIRYTGTELNRGGDCTVFCDPNHQELNGLTDVQLLANASAGRSDIEMREWISCKYNGVVDPNEESFVTALTPTAMKCANKCMAIVINSAVAAQPFDYEVYWHFEIIGSLGASMTATSPDNVGHAAVNSATQKAQIDHAGSHEEEGFLHKAVTTVLHTVTSGISKVGDILSQEGVAKTVEHGIAKYLPKVAGFVGKYGPMAAMIL